MFMLIPILIQMLLLMLLVVLKEKGIEEDLQRVVVRGNKACD